mmetsp:Transcript_15683/g.31771  ORF Transcript_15683/g.31771 Transcript_15683/m.31771 type:complete len:219 (-) Transcript_15683:974-1630(-)
MPNKPGRRRVDARFSRQALVSGGEVARRPHRAVPDQARRRQDDLRAPGRRPRHPRAHGPPQGWEDPRHGADGLPRSWEDHPAQLHPQGEAREALRRDRERGRPGGHRQPAPGLCGLRAEDGGVHHSSGQRLPLLHRPGRPRQGHQGHRRGRQEEGEGRPGRRTDPSWHPDRDHGHSRPRPDLQDVLRRFFCELVLQDRRGAHRSGLYAFHRAADARAV